MSVCAKAGMRQEEENEIQFNEGEQWSDDDDDDEGIEQATKTN